MRAINLFSLSRVDDEKLYTAYYNSLSGAEKIRNFSKHEISSLKNFVDHIHKNGADVIDCDKCFYSFVIPQIGKEFDILKISNEKIVSIELKSQVNTLEKIREQLVKNKFYLEHFSQQKSFYSYDAQTHRVYCLGENDELNEIEIQTLIVDFKTVLEPYSENLEELFSVSHFLVSPLNTPEKFLAGQYFLTLQQQEIKKEVLTSIEKGSSQGIKLIGGPGTGKTLLLYDIALHLSRNKKICVIHCGKLCSGHHEISRGNRNLRVISAASFKRGTVDLTKYECVFIDESQRFQKEQYDYVIAQLREKNIFCLFSLDQQQVLTKEEDKTNLGGDISEYCNQEFILSEKIRSNEELAAFIRNVMNLGKENKNYKYKGVDVLYAPSIQIAQQLIKLYEYKGYTFINHTPSQYHNAILDNFATDCVAHKVIGQEFDNVIVTIDTNFAYTSDGKLAAYAHPNPNYLYAKLLFQEMTRVREKLCVIVIQNPPVFERILKIKLNK